MKKQLGALLLVTIFLSSLTLLGQNKNKFSKEEQTLDFKVFKTQNNNISINEILTKKFESINTITEATKPEDYYWVKLDFENKLDQTNNETDIYLKLNSFDYGKIYYNTKQGITDKFIGLFNDKRISQKVPLDNYYSQIEVSSKNLINERYLFLRVKRITFNEEIRHWNFTSSEQPFINNYHLNDFNALTPYYILLGLCILAFFWAISFYFILRNSAFLYYTLYIILYFIYLAGENLSIYNFIFGDNHLFLHWFSQSFVFVAHIPYVLYLIYYLNTKNEYPIVHKVLKWLIFSNILSILMVCILYVTEHTIGLFYIINYGFKVIYIIPVFALFYLIYIGKNHLTNFVGIATLALCFSGIGRMFLVSPEDGLYLDSQIYPVIGFYVEIIVFAFGLTYKVYLDLLEKFKFQQEAYSNKTKALRAQINPHFIFNSLSSIQHLITSNNKVSSLKYLSKFSRLTRNILESSIETNVVLNDEIKMLEDYLELESLRFDNAFNYEINVDDLVNADTIEVPFMILQPFVENAIIHGLLPKKEGKKELKINFKKEQDFIMCKVDDNGVGRLLTSQKENIHAIGKRSRGIEVTKQRLEILRQNGDKDTDDIEIIDKMDNHGNSTGTKVIIQIPI